MHKLSYLVLFILLLLARCVYAQDSNDIFGITEGIVQDEATFYAVEGYTVFDKTWDLPFNEKSLKKLQRKYDFESAAYPLMDSLTYAGKCMVLVDRKVSKGLPTTRLYYMFPNGLTQLRIIGFTTILPRDVHVEREMIRAILNNAVPDSVYSHNRIDYIRFAGRKIKLGAACRWMGVNNVQAPGKGQMNWFEFYDKAQADTMTRIQYNGTNNKSIGHAEHEEKINVLFEGVEVQATKVVYKIRIPKVAMGGSNELVVYYVTAPVRGRYVSCVLSYYIDEGNDGHLPPLLREVMSIPQQ